jgi:hypothetical protein
VEPIDCFCCCGICRHGHECKTAGFVRELIENDLHFSDIPDLAEQVLQFAFSHSECKVSDIQFGTHSVFSINCQAKNSVRFPVIGSQATKEAIRPLTAPRCRGSAQLMRLDAALKFFTWQTQSSCSSKILVKILASP